MAAIKIIQSKVDSVVKDALVSLPRKEDHSILSELDDDDYLKFQKDIRELPKKLENKLVSQKSFDKKFLS